MSSQSETAKWYTRARRFPRLVGKLPDGTPLPFGPFTLPQIIGGAGVFYVAIETIDRWGVFGLVGNGLVLMCVLVAAVFGLGLLPAGGASPTTVVSGVMNAFSRPHQGAVGGTPVKIRPPHRAGGRVVVHHRVEQPVPRPEPVSQPVPRPEPVSQPVPRPEPVSQPAPRPEPSPAPPLTAVQQLLAGLKESA